MEPNNSPHIALVFLRVLIYYVIDAALLVTSFAGLNPQYHLDLIGRMILLVTLLILPSIGRPLFKGDNTFVLVQFVLLVSWFVMIVLEFCKSFVLFFSSLELTTKM